MIKGIIFDLDGVITDTAEFHYQAWKQLCEEEAFSFDKEFNEQLKGVSRVSSLKRILEHSKKTISQEKFDEFLVRKNTIYLDCLENLTEKDYLPGIKDFLEELKASGIKIGLGSASKNAIMVLEKLKATAFFDVIGDGNSVTNPKPAPDLFTFVAKELNLKPEECLVVEDAAPGVEAAHKANIKAIGIGSQDILGVAEIVLKDTSLLNLELIKSIK